MANHSLPPYVKLIMTISALFMPIFLILPFFFWGNGSNTIDLSEKELQKGRLAPVGRLVVGSHDTAALSDATPSVFDPISVFNSVCAACHQTGVLNAPKADDAASWQARIDARGGIEALIKSGITGLGAMPPKGGAQIADEQFAQVVHYILGQVGLSDSGAGK